VTRDSTYSGWIQFNIKLNTRPIYRYIPYWNSSTCSNIPPGWKHINPSTN